VARGPQYGPSPKDRLPGRDRPGRGGRINPGLSDVRPTRRSVVTRSLVLRRSAARRLTVARPSAPFRSWLQRALAPTRLSRSLPPPLATGITWSTTAAEATGRSLVTAASHRHGH